MIIRYSPSFLTTLKKANVRIRKSFEEHITLFAKNAHNPHLSNHALKRKYQGYRSINITADWRAIYQEKQEGNELVAYFVALGTHKELYK
ncbi:TPA: hypothetical protein DIV55_03890 [Patescibacteria group bacterium]|uniref:Plasmid stabilization system n=1 Tax=Candidatus Gottesmanbacteria bacterium GW2011_GWA1_43_11 TaxID=1618436 RepID=A0A0G1CEJ1_9BACT|nr:MAG: hypothetical protein UV59_C0027G0023 [Candidatus Gottesmanbacteria bacterium GW2011_GWA1_43_11]HCS78861.1 hypothetical protein [Patescibacteria group bacterium]